MRHRWTKPTTIVSLATGVMLLVGAYSGMWKATGLQAAATAPALGAAGSYAVLAAAGATNTGPTTVTGDLGTHPTPAVTGFFGTVENDGPGTVTGQIHQADGTALAARTALTTAYNNAAGQPTDFAVGTELGGKSLVAGVYASGTFGITAGAGFLTLTGSATDVWIFKAASTLITGASSEVRLSGGAQACNVYWQVGSSATLGASSTFQGTILSNTSISVGNSATVVGRLLAGAVADSGAVTLNNDTIAVPICALPPATATATAAATSVAATATATLIPATATAISGGGGGAATLTPTATLPPATATTVAATAIAATATAVAPATVTAVAATATAIAATATAIAPTATTVPEIAVPETPAETPAETPVIVSPTPVMPTALPNTGDHSLWWVESFVLLLGVLLLAVGLAFRRRQA